MPPLARSTLDRAAHRRTDPAWLAEAWQRARVLVVDSADDGRALVRDAAEPALVLRRLGGAAARRRRRAAVPRRRAGRHAGLRGGRGAARRCRATRRGVDLREVGHLLADRDAGLLHHRGGAGATGTPGTATRRPPASRPTVDEAGWSPGRRRRATGSGRAPTRR